MPTLHDVAGRTLRYSATGEVSPGPFITNHRSRREHAPIRARARGGGRWLTEAKILWLTRRCPRPAARFYGLNPALELAHNDVPDHGHSARGVVEARDRGEAFATRAAKNLGVFHGNLLKRLKALDGKTRRDDRDIFHSALGERFHRGVGVRLDPLRCAEARLKGHEQLFVVELELLAQYCASRTALLEIR